MTKFLNLLTDELRRSRAFYLSLITVLIVLEFMMVVSNFVNTMQETEMATHPTAKLTLNNLFSFNNGPFFLIIGGVIAAMLVYCFYTWLREWVFQDKFIYRLLLLPGSRATIGYAKITSIFLMIAGLITVQIAIFSLTNLVGSLFPNLFAVQPWYVALSQGYASINYIIPQTPAMTLIICGAGFNFLVTFFNACIVFFSYRSHGFGKTALFSIGLIALNLIYYIAIIIGLFSFARLTSTEIVVALLLAHLVNSAANLTIMHYLMNHYISI